MQWFVADSLRESGVNNTPTRSASRPRYGAGDSFLALRSLRLLEHVHPLAIAPRDLGDRGLARNLLLAPRDQRVPERRAADREADEPRHVRGRPQPLVHLLLVLTAPQDDAPHL